ncbi:Spermatocyte protein spe-8, partial [Geodia barretti]
MLTDEWRANLPDRVEPMLKQLFSARFTPTTSFQLGTHSGIESRSPLEKTGRLVRDQPLPREESKSENILSENMRNNLPNRSRRYTNDNARSRAMKLVHVKEINTKFLPVSAFPQSKSAAIANSDDATLPMYHRFASLMSPPVSSFQYQSGTGTDSSRSSSLATGSSYNPDSAIGSPGPTPPSSRPQGNPGEGDCSYLPNTTVEPTGVSLGEGAYGEVCEVSYKGNIYAAKKYKISKKEELINLHKRLKAFIQEVQIPLLISHPNIVPYCGVCRLKGDGDNQVIVMERMDKNLTEYLKEGLITLDKKFRMLLHVAKGLQHLHQ